MVSAAELDERHERVRRRRGPYRRGAVIDKELLEILACPVCKTTVVEREERLVCTQCGRRYPIRDGIPVMLVDEAEPGNAGAKPSGG